MATNGTSGKQYRRLVLVGAPLDDGSNVTGSSLGPSALRTADLPGILARVGCDVIDHGDLVPTCEPAAFRPAGRARKASDIASWIPTLSDAAYELARGGRAPVFLGGDHSLSMGTVSGIARHCTERNQELFLLWLDAHPDFNTPATSPSGNLHGMSLAFLCGEAEFDRVLRVPARNVINPSNVFLFGIRSIDSGEGELLRQRGINIVDMNKISELGVTALVRQILEPVIKRNAVLHVSLDADFLDPAIVPGVNTPAKGGVTSAQAHLIMQILRKSGRVASLDITELNPLFDVDGRSARIAAELVTSLFGETVADRHDHARPEIRYGHDDAQVN